MIDEEEVKELLVSEDVDMLVKKMEPYASAAEGDDQTCSPAERETLCKVQVLVWSRVMHLTKDGGKSEALRAAYQNLGRCWMMLGDHEKALGQLKKALEQGRTVKTLQMLSDLELNDSRYEDAIKFEQEAIELSDCNEQRMAGYTKLGTILSAQSKFDEAVETFQKAKSLDICKDSVVYADFHAKFGTLLDQVGKYQEAVDELTIAKEALTNLLGENDERTEEVAYMLDVAQSYLE